MKMHTKRQTATAASLFCSLAIAGASTTVTLQVDMSASGINYSAGDRVQLRGNLAELGSWGQGPWLTNNPTASNPYLFSTTLVFAEASATQAQYKYVMIPAGDSNLGDWTFGESSLPGSGNRLFQLTGGTQVLPLDYWSNIELNTPPTSPVTFLVDMTAQIQIGKFTPANGDVVQVRGASLAIGSWGAGPVLTNNPSASNTNLYSGTFNFTDCSGYTEAYKYVVITNGDSAGSWNNNENLTGPDANGGNRFFSLIEGGMTLPSVYYNDIVPGPSPLTVQVTFQIDLSAQVLLGNFVAGVDEVVVRGGFNGWSGNKNACTNDPSAANPNLYSTVIPIYDFPTAVEQFKYVMNGVTINGDQWETPTSTGGGNRVFTLGSNATLTLPPVFFNDTDIADFLTEDTLVTFNLSMTNAIGTDAHVFDPNADGVYLNGIFGTWWTWGSTPPDWELSVTGGEVYSLQVLFPKGSSLVVNYKYGINSSDDEAGFNQNHIRYIRQLGTYNMPLDVFGSQVVEQSFGNLTIGRPLWDDVIGTYVPVSWLGRPGVRLQSRFGLNGDTSWSDIVETDGWSSYRCPTTRPRSTYFRLVKH